MKKIILSGVLICSVFGFITCKVSDKKGQEWAIENGASLREKVRNDYEDTMAEWVMVSDIDHCAVRDILMRRYRVVKVDKVNDLMLMKRLK